LALVQAVFFDAGGTLFTERTSRAALYAEVAREHGIMLAEAAVAEAMRASHDALPRRLPGGFRYSRAWFERFIADVFERLGHPRLPLGLVRDLFACFASAETFRVYPDVVPALQQLAELDIRRGVVSNWSEGLPALIEKLGLASYFDFVLSSALIGAEKPDPPIFRQALGLARARAPDVLHVGDRVDRDIAGARSVGIQAILLDRRRLHDGGPEPRITTLLELPPLARAGVR
jgi:putative hydrolase of the HAD superfamily